MMNRRIWPLFGIVLLALPSGSAAQPTRSGQPLSHREIRGDMPDLANMESVLNERLSQAVEKGKLQDLQELFKNKALLKKLTGDQLTEQQLRVLDNIGPDKLSAILRDPRFNKLLDQAVAARKGRAGTLSKKQIESLENLADRRGELPPEPGSSDTPQVGTGPTPQDQPPEAGPRHMPQVPQVSADPATPPEEEGTWLERLLNPVTGKVMDELNDPSNVGAFQSALRSLGGLKEGKDGSEQFDLAGVWKSASEDAASWMISGWRLPGRGADAPSDWLHNVRGAVPDVSESVSGALSRLPAGRGGPGGMDERITRVAWILFAAAMAVIGWQLMMKRVGTSGRPRAETAIGPWPVAPSAVASRDDLIRAFEYLAMLRLGAAGRTSNHRAVASRLNERELDTSRRAAAGELARLYERARYEPQPGPLPEADLAAARHDLTLLAGVAPA
jgi:hypothetical protein